MLTCPRLCVGIARESNLRGLAPCPIRIVARSSAAAPATMGMRQDYFASRTVVGRRRVHSLCLGVTRRNGLSSIDSKKRTGISRHRRPIGKHFNLRNTVTPFWCRGAPEIVKGTLAAPTESCRASGSCPACTSRLRHTVGELTADEPEAACELMMPPGKYRIVLKSSDPMSLVPYLRVYRAATTAKSSNSINYQLTGTICDVKSGGRVIATVVRRGTTLLDIRHEFPPGKADSPRT